MSEKMIPLSIDSLLNIITSEYKKSGSVFSVFKPYKAKRKQLDIFEEKLEVPLGVAAGPNTQMAQNIVAAYFARTFF